VLAARVLVAAFVLEAQPAAGQAAGCSCRAA
jgi:hypothetical protein